MLLFFFVLIFGFSIPIGAGRSRVTVPFKKQQRLCPMGTWALMKPSSWYYAGSPAGAAASF